VETGVPGVKPPEGRSKYINRINCWTGLHCPIDCVTTDEVLKPCVVAIAPSHRHGVRGRGHGGRGQVGRGQVRTESV